MQRYHRSCCCKRMLCRRCICQNTVSLSLLKPYRMAASSRESDHRAIATGGGRAGVSRRCSARTCRSRRGRCRRPARWSSRGRLPCTEVWLVALSLYDFGRFFLQAMIGGSTTEEKPGSECESSEKACWPCEAVCETVCLHFVYIPLRPQW
jgi:hypothetical protein